MKKRYILVAFAVLASALTGCSNDTVTNKQVERVPNKEVSYSGSDYVTISESDEMALLLEPSTGNIRWQNKKTGTYYETKLTDQGLADTDTLSDLVVNYFSGKDSDKYSSTSEMNSYDYGVCMNTMSYEELEDGVRIVYDISSDTVTYKDFPAYISEERMNDLILQYLDDKGKKAVLNQYRLTSSGIYARKTNKEQPLAGMVAPQLYNYFYTEGHYTYDELAIDNAEHGKEDETPVKQSVVVSVDYYLDGNDLIVRIPTGEIQSNKEYPLKSLEVLPYFLSTDRTDGYLFVPDGSGALIYLDNHKLQEYQFSARYFGGDVLMGVDNYEASPVMMTLPVYGIKTGDAAVLGIIEQGAEVATLETYINGYYSGIPLTRTSLSFAIRDEQTVASYSDSATPFTLKKTSDDYYSDDIQIRYCFLADEDADYTGMAKAYQNYLLEQDALAQNSMEDQAPLFVELLGLIDKQKYFLGIPYEGTEVLTTFSQAQEILTDLESRGIQNMKVDYDGIVNGGINQRAISKVEVTKELGGQQGLKKLQSVAQSLGATIYPNVNLQTLSTSKGLNKNHKSFLLSGELAQRYSYDLIENKAKKASKYPTYIVSPTYMTNYIEAFETSYQTLGMNTLASDDFMTFIAANYKKGEQVSMTNAIPYYMDSLELLSGNHNLMLSNPISLAYRNVTYVTDVPTENSGLKILDASVPFVQMVLDGYVTYSSEKVNQDTKDLNDDLMKAMETKSALKFTFMSADTTVLQDTTNNDVFMAEYSTWSDIIGDYYEEYNAFYQVVKDATIVEHELIDRNENLVKVTYSNGIKAYFNYSDIDVVMDGRTVSAHTYVYQ